MIYSLNNETDRIDFICEKEYFLNFYDTRYTYPTTTVYINENNKTYILLENKQWIEKDTKEIFNYNNNIPIKKYYLCNTKRDLFDMSRSIDDKVPLESIAYLPRFKQYFILKSDYNWYDVKTNEKLDIKEYNLNILYKDNGGKFYKAVIHNDNEEYEYNGEEQLSIKTYEDSYFYIDEIIEGSDVFSIHVINSNTGEQIGINDEEEIKESKCHNFTNFATREKCNLIDLLNYNNSDNRNFLLYFLTSDNNKKEEGR